MIPSYYKWWKLTALPPGHVKPSNRVRDRWFQFVYSLFLIRTGFLSDSALIEYPQVLIAEEEKIIVEEINGGQTVVQEK